jgi:hypothetical protein
MEAEDTYADRDANESDDLDEEENGEEVPIPGRWN